MQRPTRPDAGLKAGSGGGNPARETYERFAPIYDRFHSANDYEMWFGTALLPALEKRGLKRGRLLDLGCGTGRAFGPMLGRGWEVVGCDLSPAMLQEARRKFGDAVPLHEANVLDLPVFGEFDLVWALNDVVNYLLEDGDLAKALAGMRANLAPGGLVLFDSNTLGAFSALFRSGGSGHGAGRWTWQGLTEEAVPGGTFESRISGPGVATHVHHERHFTEQEMTEALKAAGLGLLAVLGQQEVDGRVVLREPPNEGRDSKVIRICRAIE